MDALRVTIPVGPGHDVFVKRAARSVKVAAESPHPWSSVEVRCVDDASGLKGRSAARNEGMAGASGWLFFLDADDQMRPGALDGCSFEHDATFGRICKGGHAPMREDIYPLTREVLFRDGPIGTLSMGFFIRAEVAQALRFNEALDIGEDFEFYRRLVDNYSWVKVDRVFVSIGYSDPSATGPRRAIGNWKEESRRHLE